MTKNYLVSVLTQLEIKEGGPYKTWLVKPTNITHWQDVDLAINSNIAYFLSLQKVKLPNITKLIEKAIINDKIISCYYPNQAPLLYFISRWYQGPQKIKLNKIIASKLEQYHDYQSLDIALLCNALINLAKNQNSNTAKKND